MLLGNKIRSNRNRDQNQNIRCQENSGFQTGKHNFILHFTLYILQWFPMVKIFLNTFLGLALIIIWLQFVDIKQIFVTVSKINPFVLAPVFAFMFLSAFLRAFRLRIFLSEIKKIPLKDLFLLNGLAMMLNFFIPVRAGEIAKGVYLNTKYNLPLTRSVAWIFLDRFVDFLVVLILAAGLFFLAPTSLPFSFIIIIIFITIIIVILMYLIIYQATFAKKLFKFLSYLLIEKHIKIYFERFSNFILESFSVLKRHPRDLVAMILITILAYGADAAIWYFTFLALGHGQNFVNMYLGQLLSALTYLIPAAPGYVGSAEASGLLILSGVFGIEINLASSMTVLFHILSAVFVLIFGFIAVFSLKIDLRLIFKKALNRS